MSPYDLDFRQVSTMQDAETYLLETLPNAYNELSRRVSEVVYEHDRTLSTRYPYDEWLGNAATEFSCGAISSVSMLFELRSNRDQNFKTVCERAYNEFEERHKRLLEVVCDVYEELTDSVKDVNEAIQCIDSELISPLKSAGMNIAS